MHHAVEYEGLRRFAPIALIFFVDKGTPHNIQVSAGYQQVSDFFANR